MIINEEYIMRQHKDDIAVCRRCHRKLKDETSKKLGFGKVCYKKYINQSKVYLFDIDGGSKND